MASKRWITRQPQGRGFRYIDNGQVITDRSELQYFRTLHVPAAWQSVRIAKNKRSKILAIGIDKAGRRQYVYHPTFRLQQEQAKFERMLRFAKALPRMRSITARHLKRKTLDKKKVLACIIRLMDQAYFRVGNTVSARDNQSYGLTTLRSKHMTIRHHTIIFDFTGKSGQHQSGNITSKMLARIIKQLDELPGYEIFRYHKTDGRLATIQNHEVNTYIKDIMGDAFSAKDFRTWGGTLLAMTELTRQASPQSITGRRRALTLCIKHVASRLGNTQAITRRAYVDPRLTRAYIETGALGRRGTHTTNTRKWLDADERRLVAFLKSQR